MLLGGEVLACAICAPADGQGTLVYRLYAADSVVLATADAAGGAYRVDALIKGSLPAEPIVVKEWPSGGVAPKAGASVLLLYGAATRAWHGVGALSAGRAGWVRRLIALHPASTLAQPDWPARLAFFAPDLEDSEPMVAQAAYEEVAVAPYGAMRQIKGRLSPARLRSSLADPAQAARRPLYTLLLGIAGDAGDAQRMITMASKPAAASGAPAVPALSAALAAVLELRGSAGVDWLEQTYLARADRSEFEVQAAVLALGVHGNDATRVSRERVIAAYQTLAQRNPAMAGFTASDLAAWERWEFGTRFAEILRSAAPLAFAARYPMVFFLLRSPRAEDRAAVQALRAAGRI